MTYNRITAEIGESRRITTRPISYQYDTVQILMLTAADGVELPSYFQVDFCVIGDTDTVTIVGSLTGGAPIPDSLLQQGENLMAYLVLTGSESDVQTRYEITIPVNERPTRSGIEMTSDQQAQVDSLVAALNDGVERAEAASQAVQDMGVEAETLPEGSQATVEKTVDPDTGAVTLGFGIPEGRHGATGATPDIQIGTVTTGAPGSQAAASITGTREEPRLNLTIPQGPQGDAGVTSVNGKTGAVVLDATDVGAYAKPSGGIPKTDLDQSVQTSLGLANTALQSAPVTSVNNKTGAVVLSASDVGAKPASYEAPVSSVNEKTGEVVLDAGDIGYESTTVESELGTINSALNALDEVVIEHPISEYRKADVRSGSLQANGTYATESDAFGVGYKIPLAPNGKITITPYGPEGFKYGIRFVAFAEGETSGTLTQTGALTDEDYTFTQSATKSFLMFCIYYKHSDGTDYNDILDEFSDTDILVKTEVITEVLPLARIDDIEPVQEQMTEQAETLEFDHRYLNILQGASTFQDNKFISDRGIVVTNPNFCLIDGFFPVKPNTTYKLYRDEPPLYSNAGHNWTFWDANKSFISYTLSGAPVTSPANAAYLRFAVYISSTGSATHQDFDPTKVIITEDGNPFFDDIFIKTTARPTFNGLKWIGIGDSITEDNFRATYHYWSYIATETGLNFVNMGVSGTGYKAEGSGDKAFYKRVPSMATDADVITIFGGVNDVVLSSATIGTETDTGTETICGCVNTTLDAIETLYPAHMPIGIISPLPCYCSDTTVNIHPYQQPNDDTCRMAQFVEQLALICKHRGIPFLDLFHQSNLRPWHQECNAKYFSCDSAKTGDGLHPNGHGHRLIYRQIKDFVQKIVMQ